MENEVDTPNAETAAVAIVGARFVDVENSAVIVSRTGAPDIVLPWPASGSQADDLETWISDGHSIAPAAAPVVDLVAYAASVRYQREVGGIDVGGALILTDRASQGLINGAWNLAKEEPAETIEFKGATGWVELDSATMSAIGIAVGRHVRGLFKIERQVAAAIDAGAITTTAEVDAAFAAAD